MKDKRMKNKDFADGFLSAKKQFEDRLKMRGMMIDQLGGLALTINSFCGDIIDGKTPNLDAKERIGELRVATAIYICMENAAKKFKMDLNQFKYRQDKNTY